MNNQSGPIFETSEGIAEIAAALAKAQSEFGPIHKDAKAEEKGVAKGSGKPYSMSYSYAKLPKIMAAITPALSKNGICLVQAAGLNCVVTRIAHSSGEWMQCTTPVFPGRMDGARGWGSGVSYSKRFGVMSLTGVAPDDESDDDGAMADAPYRNHGRDQEWRDDAPSRPAQEVRAGMMTHWRQWLADYTKALDGKTEAEINAMQKANRADIVRLGELDAQLLDDLKEAVASARAKAPSEIDPSEDGATSETPAEFAASTGVHAPEAPQRISRSGAH